MGIGDFVEGLAYKLEESREKNKYKRKKVLN
jgi:hypothetical protein